MKITKAIELGSTPPCEVTTQIAADMEALAFSLWRRKQDCVSVITWAADKCFRVTCRGEWFDNHSGYGLYAWEVLIL